MKKLIAGAFALSMATSAMAATVSFDYGSSWFRPRMNFEGSSYDWTAQGSTFAVNWALDNDTWIGVYAEALNINDGYGDTYPWTGQALQFSKGIVKNVAIGVRLGTFNEAYNYDTGALTDVYGAVTILSGSGDKVSANLKAEVAGRWADNEWQGGEDWSGYTVGLSAGVAF
jgi:hypothetical protein